MFDFDFYPTPYSVISKMLFSTTIKGKNFLEPSAGNGNIVDFLIKSGAKSVEACELQADLRAILSTKCPVVSDDFLKLCADDVSHIDCIVMNPPFSKWKQHILHAWDIAPEGCEILSLCNSDSLNDLRSGNELYHIIKDNGVTEELGQCFKDAERKTNVEIALIKLYKPIFSQSFDYDGFFYDVEPEIQFGAKAEIMPYNEIRAFVEHYVRLTQCYDEFDNIAKKMGGLMEAIGISVFQSTFQVQIGSSGNSYSTKEAFVKKVKKIAWRTVFDKLKLQKFVTAKVMEDINRFVEEQSNIPFTVKNIYRMMNIIIFNRDDIMNKAIEDAIDNITKYISENRYGVEGWKTNSGYMLNKKFIFNYGVRVGFRDRLEVQYSSSATTQMDDLVKAICYVTGKNYDDYDNLYQFFYRADRYAGVWYDFGLFEIKGFKKGTLHVKFKDLKDWEAINRAYAKIKGQTLPEKM